MYILHSIHSSIDGYLCYFQLLATVNNVPMNPDIQVSIQVFVFDSFERISRSGIAGLYGNTVFNFLRNFYTVFHSGHTI